MCGWVNLLFSCLVSVSVFVCELICSDGFNKTQLMDFFFLQIMDVLLLLLLVFLSKPGGSMRLLRQGKVDQLSKKDIVKVLSHLLADKVEEKIEEKERIGRQFPGFANPLGECEVVGYETKVREECEEVSNIECKKINVTMYRPEIRERCKTSFDQSCNVTYKDVPTDKCESTARNR